jgi:signal transduction histidine kinase
MIFSFTLIIILSIITIDYIVLTRYIDERISELQIRSFATANIIADQSQYQLNNDIGLRTIIFQYANNIDGRILILNVDGQVIVDSFYNLEGETILSREVKSAINNSDSVNLYSTPSKLMQLAVPITATNDQNNQQVVGAVLLSLPMDEIDASFQQLRQHVIFISLTFTIIAIILTIIASLRLTKPLKKLTSAAKNISKGKLGTQVNISGKDEIARFSHTFNEMSKELEYIDKNRRNFISSVSHELRTPLASIKALIQPLLDGETEIKTYREFLGDIDGEIDRLSNLISSLLTLTRMEELKLNLKTQDLNTIIDRVLDILNPIAKENEVSLINQLPDYLQLNFDSELITEVFLNLFENGIKYKDPLKNSFVSISSKDEPSSINIIIKDNGMGMDKEVCYSIFKPFYRAEHSRSRLTGGYGLGLSIVSKIVDLHNWSIEVDSILGKESIFTIKIPK